MKGNKKAREEFIAILKRNSPTGVITVEVPDVFEIKLPDGYKITKEDSDVES